MRQDDLSDIQNDARSQNLVRAIERFIRILNEQAGEKHAAKVVLDGAVLRGSELNQKPERFIEEELIDPVMQVLGYEPRFQPTGFKGLGVRQPDFTALNLDVTNFGEVKKPGKIENAREESFEYLTMATDRPIIGIATDGFVWILHTATKSDEQPTYTHHVALHDLFKKIRLEQTQPRAERRSRPHLRDLSRDFVSQFNASYIETLVTAD
ncbi:hypothetical protein HT576_11720 [Haloterrigena sp. SYSU A121-1]|uniref:Uncharacterized protein n=1 Tax=Haloterrigena gelatinilytica TaxID=2741724 RepID=A0A8J8GPN5_9EURY|nr:hypothetical protein [Haloterrigena gelatinilytica]NUB91682.1 hypothetical protein [Haloterrigena gelatinilytica]